MNKASYPSPTLEAKLRKWDGVYTVKQQGRILGVSDDTVSRWRQHIGIAKTNPVPVPITQELDAQIRQMFLEGAGRVHVSQITGVGQARLAELYPWGKMDPQTKGSLGGAVRNLNRKVRV